MQQPSVCYCSSSEEARNISKFGDPHVHCPCDKCKGKATWRMTAWRHLQAKNYYNSEPSSKIQRLDNPNEPDLESSQDFDSIDSCTNDDRNSLASDNFVSDTSEHDVDEQIFTDQELMKEFVQDAVLRLLEMKEKMHCSEKHVVELLEWGKMLHTSGNNKEAEQYWPKNWNDVQVLLKTIGFVEPKLYWICLRSDHPNHYGLMESQDEFCPYCGQTGHIPYYYMSLIERVKTWCSNKEMCHKMTTHWRNKEHWLPDEMKEGWGWHSKSELWDGCRFAELSYFWNPNRGWYLPARCAFEGCENIISAEVMIQSPVKNDGVTRVVTCQECGSSFNHIPVEVRGDPRNIAYTGHWDGWQPFSSPFRGCGAIEVSIATMGKLDRCHKDQVYVIGFVPSYLIPNKRSDALDPFLEPLIKDLERGFIDGINVDYKIPIDDIAVGNTVIRHLLLCWKGDHNGQCESGKFIKCGKKACRRCHLEAVWIADSNHYYYPEFRKQGRYPNQEKSILDNMNIIQDIDQEERRSVKAAKAKDSGYTGLSILHRLYPLYGFLYDQDLVFDEMHILPLNIVKHHIQLFLDDEDGIFSDINWKEVDERLERFPWTAEQRAGRIPKCISKRFNYWKAEELSQFIFPAAEICFSGMLDSSHYDILVCLCRIVEYVVNHSRNGWTEEEANTFYEMCLRYGILVEETYGVKRCVITLHSILHLYKDIQRFGSLDNYSCWTEERAVHHYIKKSNNHKNIELTFALSELRQEILKFRKTAQVITQSTTSKFDSEKAWAHSLASAKVLIVKNGEEKFHDGVIVGGHQWCAIDLQDRQMISAVKGVAIKDVAQIGSTARSLWKPNSSFGGLLYRAGDYAMFAHPEVGDTVIELRKFVSLKVKGCALVCAHAEEYTYCGYTESGMMQVQPTQNTILIEAALISRKIMLTQMLTEDDDEEVKFTLIDYMRRLFPVSTGTVIIPYYPEEHDMVEVKGDSGEKWIAHVLKFSHPRKTIKARFFQQHPIEQNKWVPERSPDQLIHFSSILSISRDVWEVQYTSWIKEN